MWLLYWGTFQPQQADIFLISCSSCVRTTTCCLSVILIFLWCHLVWPVEPCSPPSGVAISDPSFSLNPCFRHAKLTATLWVNAACECWDGRGVSEWKAPMRATCMVLHNWLHSAFFKGPSFSLCLFCTASLFVAAVKCATDRPSWASLLTNTPYNLMLVSIRERSDGYVCVLFHPGCCQSRSELSLCWFRHEPVLVISQQVS